MIIIEEPSGAETSIGAIFNWPNEADIPNVETFFPAETFVEDEVVKSLFARTNLAFIVFETLDIVPGQRVVRKRERPRLPTSLVKRPSVPTGQSYGNANLNRQVKLRKVDGGVARMHIGVGWPNTQTCFCDNEWKKVPWGMLPFEDDVTLPFGRWVFTRGFSSETSADLIFIGLRISVIHEIVDDQQAR
jgi:hypothetical protein